MTDVSTPVPGSRALVLGGGGVAGIAWEVGVLVALQEAGVDLDAADLVVGTSAGSVVGAFVRNGAVQQAYDQQHTPAPTTYQEPAPIDVEAVQQHIGAALQGATGEQDARARLGQAAQQVVGGQSDDERTVTFGETLPSTEWPEKPLAVTAVDATDGTFRLLTAADGVPLPRAVAASCSVPFVWTPVTIDGRPHVDGGVRSGTNADAAAGYERVLVIACGPEGPSPCGPWLDVAVEALRAGGSSVEVVVADSASQQAFGTNSLSLATQAPSAEAGHAQGTAVAEQVAAFWAEDLASVHA
ncbi:patatin-like phospholipase family protein [Curtobacterium flaccumfaciens]|uniref:Patatin-like phospholipase family protein n=1 Tax=Curtobacterium poinsettiae TaxID=159612 RepID=A0A9Q9T224_9MICO|nr:MULTISPECIES: patatin-like phospholipase family protein [Curtobacterium]MCS6560339.1 patatin-like phospholipase family protein [Curtobacterium flaccumfaciens pv. poinsettiae]UXN24566.1 patatin-like phospholipase family protein [Curtobacterium flaccumfaciens]UYC79402.1 patatin-like phospholipase family protein [Curtobacterium flaccumfaciens pv. poinsettiae]